MFQNHPSIIGWLTITWNAAVVFNSQPGYQWRVIPQTPIIIYPLLKTRWMLKKETIYLTLWKL